MVIKVLMNSSRLNFGKMTKNLAVFDFDHTIINANSDTVVRDMIPSEKIPSSLAQLHKKDGWTSYMQAVFELLSKHNIDKCRINETIENLQPVSGMCELITLLNEELNYDVIIISDSNTYFINKWLEKFNLITKINCVFSNPAEFKNGLLKIQMYHHQTDCKLSTKNLCKGRILNEYILAQNLNFIFYDKIVYCGDGANDLCPILKLNESDLACVREGYKCIDLIKSIESGKPVDISGKIYKIKSTVCVWKTGHDIISYIRNKFI